MLFGLGYGSDHQSMLVDARDEAHAIELGTEIAEGERPARVKAIPPGLFVAGLFSEDDEGVIVVDAHPHVEEFLELLDVELTGEAIEVAEVEPTCASEAEAVGSSGVEIVRCEFETGHDGDHEAATKAGRVIRWPNE
jgi:hypothetical protein